MAKHASVLVFTCSLHNKNVYEYCKSMQDLCYKENSITWILFVVLIEKSIKLCTYVYI